MGVGGSGPYVDNPSPWVPPNPQPRNELVATDLLDKAAADGHRPIVVIATDRDLSETIYWHRLERQVWTYEPDSSRC